MAASSKLVIQTEHLDAAAASWLGNHCKLRKCSYDDLPAFEDLLGQAEGLVIRTYTRITPDLLAKAPRLRVVGRAGVGLDNVDLAACAARNVAVVHTPDANTRAVIEYVFALMLDVVRPRAFLQEFIDAPRWREAREELKGRRQLCEMTLGILGLGRIGKGVARVASALGMRVLYHDLVEIPSADRAEGIPVSRAELMQQADILTIHVDGRAANRDLLKASDFAGCKPDVTLINTSRGFVIENMALAEFMIANPEATAMLDVHEPEPFDGTYPLLDIANIHLAPHIASATELAHANMSWVVRDVWRVLSGERPEFLARPDPA
ncbi:MAG: NAD(P)-dependent oxidoreductase [Phycisphaerales bacterium]